MSSNSPPAETPMWMVCLGWLVSILPVLVLAMSGTMKLLTPAQIAEIFEHFQKEPPDLAKGFSHLQWPHSLALGLGILELACAIAYLIPRTATFGAILATGYLGGAIATHVRIGDPFVTGGLAPLILGFLIWLGLLLRDENVRAVLPLRSPYGGSSWFVKILFVLVTVGVALVVIVALQPGEFKIERSKTINAPASEVFPYVNDFKQWKAWNPFLDDDPDANITISDPDSGKGATYEWEGNSKVGKGKMVITESKPNELVKIKIEFLAPVQMTADVAFVFKEKDDKTEVIWSMAGESNLMFKAFDLVIGKDKMIGEKYEEGLKRMKKAVEEKK